ncbi:hypothetical protein BO83DRAFT_404254 [Aspergillus eucalypticola CBS 122712]|uniref:Uncharacterized protein n=1 Tax=Aspergillus eucalypticola (strain CBS 122712 / IBT 29274) TaxID=1448314 RepID=A0A317UKI0_ASPEC|nr:uncharacterized protein BO83DRAFT_404254 [Aspergillus eucalypticola CBS 122712]PWY61895.1 hypothetical protein BO83DRAFT_404254 [Aspergillus eucalypticola CBS 122712]
MTVMVQFVRRESVEMTTKAMHVRAVDNRPRGHCLKGLDWTEINLASQIMGKAIGQSFDWNMIPSLILSCASIFNLSLDRIIGFQRPFLILSDRETRSLYARRDVAYPTPIILVSSLGDPLTSAMPAPRNNGVVSPSPPGTSPILFYSVAGSDGSTIMVLLFNEGCGLIKTHSVCNLLFALIRRVPADPSQARTVALPMGGNEPPSEWPRRQEHSS